MLHINHVIGLWSQYYNNTVALRIIFQGQLKKNLIFFFFFISKVTCHTEEKMWSSEIHRARYMDYIMS